MKRLLVFVAACEGLTGLLVLASPALVSRLLFNAEVAGAGVAISRLAGISLIALAVACWPDRDLRRAVLGMLTYNLLTTLLLGAVGASGDVGMLLWPAAAAHAGLAVLLVWTWRQARRAPVHE